MLDLTGTYISFLAIGEIILFFCFVFCIYQNRLERSVKKFFKNKKGEDVDE
jgi:predicted PurR-regulated permease PerM